MAFHRDFLESIRTDSLEEDVKNIYDLFKNRFLADTMKSGAVESVTMSHVSCLKIFNEDKYLNLLFGVILQNGYRSEAKKSEIGICIYFSGDKRQIKLDVLFQAMDGQQLISNWISIVLKAIERKEKKTPTPTTAANTTPDCQLMQAVPEKDKLIRVMQTLYNNGDKLMQKQIGAALRQQGYQHGEVQTILGCHINKRKFGIF
jgi:hypothetical protein